MICVILWGYKIYSSIDLPLIKISPYCKSSWANKHLKVVDLPAPLVPNKLKHSFFLILNDIPSIAFINELP